MQPKTFEKAVETLTPRERVVVECVAKGWGNPRIASHFGLSRKTIENTIARAMKKFEPRISRGELIRLWTLQGK